MFKVGDWVTYEKGKDFETARVEIVGQIPNYIGVSTGENVPLDECGKWKPQAGEWCWFWNNETASATLNRFITSYGKDANETLSAEVYKHCEPFTGELPSFIKDIL